MAQAVNQNLTPDEIRKVKHSKTKTISLAITETQEYDLETQEEGKSVLEYGVADAPSKAMEQTTLEAVQGDNCQNASAETKEVKLVSATGINHPLAHLAGKYADEPLWDDFMAAIEDYRRKQNELEDTEE